MGRWIRRLLGILLIVGLGLAALWTAVSRGWLGSERGPGIVHGQKLPDAIVAARDTGASEGQAKIILFGDLHVHTTYSTDAFQWALPMLGGTGAHPLADACDFARFCSNLDFWAITDHAEASTPERWANAKKTMRACQAVADNGGGAPDLISFVGFEWTQVGRLPSEHFGHKNVIFRDLDDDRISARTIAASGVTTQTLRTKAVGMKPTVALGDWEHREDYFDFNTFLKKVRDVPSCDAKTASKDLPKTCFEEAATPEELIARLDSQGVKPLIIPHGSTWGFYTPPGTSWDKSLAPVHRPDRFSLIEVYSGHGNSEEYRNFRDIELAANGTSAICPKPTATYLPSCWRAGEIIMDRCTKAGEPAAECEKSAADARSAHANMGVAGHLAIKGEQPEDWLDAGQCTDCFLPAFNYRTGNSVQYGLAISHFDKDSDPLRFRWGFIGSSDNHRARPGTGYKPVDRRENTESAGAISEVWRQRINPPAEKPEARATPISREKLQEMAGFQLTEFERQTSFFLTGGLAAVHAEGRNRGAIWDALERREVYATSGQRILLWFDHLDSAGKKTPMGSTIETKNAPTFEVRAQGAFRQKPGCPDFSSAGVDEKRLKTLCSGECFNPSNERAQITRIEVVRIRPQISAGEPVDGLIDDKFIVHACPPNKGSCSFRFSDPSFVSGKRNTLYYVRAIQEAAPTINANPIQCVRDKNGKCIKAKLCFGDYRSGSSECTAPAEPRAWSSPIYVDYAKR